MKNSILILLDFTRKLLKSRQMLWAMAMRDLRAKYIGSVFGFAWAVLNPLSQVIVYGAVFGLIFKSTPDPVYGTDSFFLFILAGLLPWQFFSQGVLSSMASITSNSNLVKKAVGFPSELLPIVAIISNFISHLIGMGLFMVVYVAFEKQLPLYAPVILIYLFMVSVFSVGLGWMLSSISVYIRDLRQVVDMVMLAWFFFTPIFFPPSRIPASLDFVLKLNPMYAVVEGYRMALLAGKLPDLQGLLYLTLVSFLCFGIGGVFFRKLKPGFAEVL